jgi:transposase
LTVDGCLRQLDFLGDELAQIDAVIAQQVLSDDDGRRLMTIPGIDVVTATTLVAVIGDVRRLRRRVISSAISGCIRRSANRQRPRPPRPCL